MVGFIVDARCEETAVPLRLLDSVGDATPRSPLVATRLVLMGVLWVTWQLQPHMAQWPLPLHELPP